MSCDVHHADHFKPAAQRETAKMHSIKPAWKSFQAVSDRGLEAGCTDLRQCGNRRPGEIQALHQVDTDIV